jgi:hypothetical protein
VNELRTEVRKLLRRGTLFMTIAWLGSLGFFASFYLSNAQTQFEVASANYNQIAQPPSLAELCEFLAAPVGPECDRARHEELGFAREFLHETSRLYPVASAAQDPVAVGGMVAGLMASLLGFVVVGGVAAAHTAGEWNHGTVKVVLARDPRRIRFVWRKFLTAWIAGTALLGIGWAGMAALTPVFRRLYEVPPGPSGFTAWGYTGGQLPRAVIVIGVVAALGTAAGVLLRGSLGAFGLVLGLLFVSLTGTAWRSTFKWSVGYWVAAWMRFRPETGWGDHVWVDRFPVINPDASFHPSPWVGLIGLTVTLGVAMMVASFRMVRSDVGG